MVSIVGWDSRQLSKLVDSQCYRFSAAVGASLLAAVLQSGTISHKIDRDLHEYSVDFARRASMLRFRFHTCPIFHFGLHGCWAK